MDRLWAPWRLEYIKTTLEPSSDCFLCDAAASGVNRERLVLFSRPPVQVVMNLYPYNNGHLLVAPLRHIADLKDLAGEESLALMQTMQLAMSWLNAAYNPQGYNIGLNIGRAAGAGLPGHLHFHIVPRWRGDVNFMSVIGETKVISEALEEGYNKLMEVIESSLI